MKGSVSVQWFWLVWNVTPWPKGTFSWNRWAENTLFCTAVMHWFNCALSRPGCTWEFASMVGYIKRTYPQTQLIVVGFSLGGNIVCKFLGESMTNQERVLCCVSICQGYSALRWVAVVLSCLRPNVISVPSSHQRMVCTRFWIQMKLNRIPQNEVYLHNIK